MTEEVAEVNMKYVAIFVDHYVIWVPIPNSEDERGNTVTSTGVSKGFDSLLVSVKNIY